MSDMEIPWDDEDVVMLEDGKMFVVKEIDGFSDEFIQRVHLLKIWYNSNPDQDDAER